LFAEHQQLGARLVEFGGWEMPVQYTSIVDEHLAVRRAAGLFDISHMGEVRVRGPRAAAFLNRALTNDIARLAPGQGQYTLMCNERGGVVDDLYAYQLAPEDYLLIINASRIEADVAWLTSQWRGAQVTAADSIENHSDQFGAIAVQGPRVAEFIGACFPGPSQGGLPVPAITALKKNQIGRFSWAEGIEPVWVGRTGYTGEDGFEAVVPAAMTEAVWGRILEAGKPCGLRPAGLGARDTLRTEMGYPLYGHELDETTTPIEAGVGFFVSLDKGEFMGRAVLAGQKVNGVSKRCIAFKLTDRSAPPRPGYAILDGAAGKNAIGKVVSGTQSPSLGVGIGMGYVPPASAQAGTAIAIDIRGRACPAVIVQKPIFRRPSS
jgi:aminomethyltransferase